MRRLLSGNEAIARGAFEAGVTVGAGYPGTPSTEILESLARYKPDVYCEWSPNEKVAFEVAAGASQAFQQAAYGTHEPGSTAKGLRQRWRNVSPLLPVSLLTGDGQEQRCLIGPCVAVIIVAAGAGSKARLSEERGVLSDHLPEDLDKWIYQVEAVLSPRLSRSGIDPQVVTWAAMVVGKHQVPEPLA
mgnify:CR=1 FL=1